MWHREMIPKHSVTGILLEIKQLMCKLLIQKNSSSWSVGECHTADPRPAAQQARLQSLDCHLLPVNFLRALTPHTISSGFPRALSSTPLAQDPSLPLTSQLQLCERQKVLWLLSSTGRWCRAAHRQAKLYRQVLSSLCVSRASLLCSLTAFCCL